jgi:CRP-like cAMP-binding protein
LVRESLMTPSSDGNEACVMSKRRSSAVRSHHRGAAFTPHNLLLASLPKTDRDRLMPSLEVIPLKLRVLLYKPGEPVQYVYFPGGGFCSIVTVLADGSMVEVATVGREGMLGVSALVDAQPPMSATLVQGETDLCYRMTVKVFRSEMDARGAFYGLMTRYIDAHIGVVMQSTACNAVHSVEQRLARWLLMAHDRMATPEFKLTQEFAAMMLGAARPTVTLVAGTLQRAGLITYRRGRVTIVDREQLESASCECYEATTRLLQSVTAARRR